MASIVLTPKVACYGVLAGLPAADVSTTCVSINPTYFNAAIPAMSPAVQLGQYVIIKMNIQNAVGAAVRTVRILKSDASVLLTFPVANQPADPTNATTIFSARAIVTNVADWANITIQVSAGAAGDVVTIKAGSLVFGFAESCNIIDEKLVKRNVSNIYFICMQPVQEAILGKIASPATTTFSVVPVNGLVSGIQWNTNSGNTLYSWDGASIGIGA